MNLSDTHTTGTQTTGTHTTGTHTTGTDTTGTRTDQRWAIARDGEDVDQALAFLSEDQEWGPLDIAMLFSSEAEAANGAETLCPPFMPGHPRPVTRAELGDRADETTPIPGASQQDDV